MIRFDDGQLDQQDYEQELIEREAAQVVSDHKKLLAWSPDNETGILDLPITYNGTQMMLETALLMQLAHNPTLAHLRSATLAAIAAHPQFREQVIDLDTFLNGD